MKNLKTYLICILLLSSFHLFSQTVNTTKGVSIATNMNSQSDFAQSQVILLDKDTKESEFLIEVAEGSSKLMLKIEGRIEEGFLTLEVYDPKGERTGHFKLSAQAETAKKEVATGNFSKSLANPQSGKWKVKIVPGEVNGMISIQSTVTE